MEQRQNDRQGQDQLQSIARAISGSWQHQTRLVGRLSFCHAKRLMRK